MQATTTPPHQNGFIRVLLDVAIVFAVVQAAALFGILSRPVGFLAAVWPANAILFGLMVRNPRLATPLGWLSAFVSFIAADMLTGAEFGITLWLTLANMAGAMLGYFLCMRLSTEDRSLSHPISIVWFFAICLLSAGLAAAVGSGAARVLFDRDIVTGFIFWFTTELVNMLIVLPAILTWPGLSALKADLRRKQDRVKLIPALVLGILLVVSPAIGGPGAFAYPIPALIWCALTYSLFTTAVLSLCFSLIQLIAAAVGWFPAESGVDELLASVSLRLAISLLIFGPLAVASVNSAREELVARLNHVANHDALTGALSRGAFMEHGQRSFESSSPHSHLAVLMLDIDHFKSVNDKHGHPTGDRMLTEATRVMRASLREHDLLGRLGGEEFAILLAGIDADDALIVAERIRSAVEDCNVLNDMGTTVQTSVSIGISHRTGSNNENLSTLLAEADKALYLAKTRGRNLVVEMERPRVESAQRSAA